MAEVTQPGLVAVALLVSPRVRIGRRMVWFVAACLAQAVQERGRHGVVAQVFAPVLHDALGRHDDAALEFVALVYQRFRKARLQIVFKNIACGS